MQASGPKPTLARSLLEALLKQVLGDISAEMMDEYISHRDRVPTSWGSVVDDNQDLVQEVLHQKDVEPAEEPPKTKRQKLAEVVKAGVARQKPQPPSADPDRPSPSCSSTEQPAHADANRSEPIRAAPNQCHWSQEQAAAYLPKVRGCIILPVNNRRWQVKYLLRPTAPRSCTATDEPEGEGGCRGTWRPCGGL